MNNSSSEDKPSDVYIKRGEKEEKFLEQLKNSLGLGDDSKENPNLFLFLINGFAGIGKRKLLERIEPEINIAFEEKKQEEAQKREPIFIKISFDRIGAPSTPIELMEEIDKKIEEEAKKSSKNDGRNHFQYTFDSKTNNFSKSLNDYTKALERLKTEPVVDKRSVETEQRENVQKLSNLGTIVTKTAAATLPGMQPVAALLDTQLAKKVTESVGDEVMELSNDLANQLIDRLLNQHKATKDKEIQKLLLNPLETLTPKFISSLYPTNRLNAI